MSRAGADARAFFALITNGKSGHILRKTRDAFAGLVARQFFRKVLVLSEPAITEIRTDQKKCDELIQKSKILESQGNLDKAAEMLVAATCIIEEKISALYRQEMLDPLMHASEFKQKHPFSGKIVTSEFLDDAFLPFLC